MGQNGSQSGLRSALEGAGRKRAPLLSVRRAVTLAGMLLALALVACRTAATGDSAASLGEPRSSGQPASAGTTAEPTRTRGGPHPGTAAPGSSSTFALRARGLDVHELIVLVSRSKGRCLLMGPEVTGTLSIDAEKSSILEIQDEAVRASGAASVVLGNAVVLGDTARLASARGNPLQPLMTRGGYTGRKVSLFFDRYRLTNLLRLLAEVSKRPFEVAEGVEGAVTIGANEMPWTEVLDSLALTFDLTREEVGRTIRVSRRGDPNPRFSPLGRDLVGGVDDPRTPPEAGPGKCRPPLCDIELDDLKLVGVMTGPLAWGPEALVRMPSGKCFTLRKGSCVGSSGVVVARIERDRVVFARDDPDRGGRVAEGALKLEGDGPGEPRTAR